MPKCRNCDKNVVGKEFVSQSIMFPGKVLTAVEHEDGLLYCGHPFEPWDKRVAQLPEGEARVVDDPMDPSGEVGPHGG